VSLLIPLEALAVKRLVVSSDVGGHKELIEDGKTGVLFEAGNPEALASVIDGLINNKESWAAMHDTGRSYVENVRNWGNSVANYEAIYKRITQSR